jgi:PmbA protein
VGGRTAVCSTSALDDASLSELAAATVELARLAAPDPYAGLPAGEELAKARTDGLQLFDEAVASMSHDERLRRAEACEAAALAADNRITNTDGATMTTGVGEVALVNSLGFSGHYPQTSASLAVEVMADDADGKKRNGAWYSAGRHLHRLLEPGEVGAIAARRAVGQLGARKVTTKSVPVVLEPRMTADLLRLLAGCANGAALYRGATFLADMAGREIGSEHFTVTDDPALPGGLGSRPFDDEGLAPRRTELFVRGAFKEFMFDVYTARRAGAASTGAAHRSVASLPSPSSSNLFLAPGATPAADLVRDVDEGLLVTTLMGFGFNPATGDYSRGAAGYWIERGEIAFPVSEVNISGRMQDMLAGVDAVGDDFEWFGSIGAPSVRIRAMAVSGL